MGIFNGGGTGGGSGAVSSVFTRTGAVVATAGDYNGVAVGGTADAVAAQAITNAMVNNTAAIAKTKLASLDVVNADVNASAAIALTKLADPGTGKVLGSASSAAAAVNPPGYEFGYDQITSGVNVTSTTESSGTTIITCAAHTFDGSPVLATFYTPYGLAPNAVATNNFMIVSLFESTTEIGKIAVLQSNGNASVSVLLGSPLTGMLRFTPSAASHTYTVTAFVSGTTGTPNIGAGAGGTGALVPAFVRFTKV